MGAILLVLAAGVLLGATVFPERLLKWNNRITQAGIVVTLFAMGVSLGASPTLLQDLRQAGGKAVVFALLTVAGSVAVVAPLSKLFREQKPSRKGLEKK